MELAAAPRVPDHLQEDLPEGGPRSCLGAVLERSRRLCLQRYEKELFSEAAWQAAASRCQERLTPEQLAVFAGWAASVSSCWLLKYPPPACMQPATPLRL